MNLKITEKKIIDVYEDNPNNKEIILSIENKNYLISTDEHLINKYSIRKEKLDPYFSKLTNIIYLNKQKNILIIPYPTAPSLREYSQKGISYDSERVANLLHQKLSEIHVPLDYQNVSSHFDSKNWLSQITNYTNRYLKYLIENFLITKEDEDIILNFIKKHEEIFLNTSLYLIHTDINDENVCYDISKNKLELRRYENVLVGDLVYEYTRMHEYIYIDAFKFYLNKYVKNLEKEPLFPFYQVYFNIMTLAYEHKNNYDYQKAKEKLVKLVRNLESAS